MTKTPMTSSITRKGFQSYSSVYERSDATKFIGRGNNRRFLEPVTKSSDRSDELPIVPVMKKKNQFDVPEWMVEQKSPGTERRDVDISDINAFLKYPSNYFPRRKELGDKVKESKIYSEVAKREKQDIPMLPAEEDDEEESDEEETDDEGSEEESDEFEEEIVVMNVRRNPLWRKGLQIPKPEPEKVGIPVEDLLEIPTLEAKQESAPDELLIDEKIEFVERPPVVHAEVADFCILEKL